jgi:hypothetical protein
MSFSSLAEALEVMSRVSRRQDVEPGTIRREHYTAGIRMRLDTSQLAEAVPIERARFARVVYRLGLVQVAGDPRDVAAMTGAPVKAPAWLRYVLVLVVALAASRSFLLATATAITTLFAQRYPDIARIERRSGFRARAARRVSAVYLATQASLAVFGSQLTRDLLSCLRSSESCLAH